MKVLVATIIAVLIHFVSYSQKKRIVNLSVGDTVPNIVLRHIINSPVSKPKLSDFESELLILDFWATWCAPCVAAFDKHDSIRLEFGKRVSIIPITDQDSNLVADFFRKRHIIKGNSLPMSVTGDRVFSKLFFHRTLPHYVWLNKDRKVVAITGFDEVNKVNIRSYLAGDSIVLKLKREEDIKIVGFPKLNPGISVVEDGLTTFRKLDTAKLTVHSELTKYIEGLGSGASFPSRNYFIIRNAPIIWLYKVALLGNSFSLLNTSANNIKIEVPDSNIYRKITTKGWSVPRPKPGVEYLNWLKENGYCYELLVPGKLAEKRFNIMKDDLNLYFGAIYGIEGAVEKRVTKYLSLVRTISEDKIATKSSVKDVKTDLTFHLHVLNAPLKSMITMLAKPLQLYPQIVDETGYIGNVDIELNCELSNLVSLNKELERYGLKLEEKKKEMEVAVIRMKK